MSVERVPKFSDIKREYNMDEDLKASGYNKQVEKDLEEELRPDECNSEDENSQNEQSQGKGNFRFLIIFDYIFNEFF